MGVGLTRSGFTAGERGISMVKVKNVGEGIYTDGSVFVHPGGEIDVPEEQAAHLCAPDTAGRFERVKEEKPAQKDAKK